MILGGAYHLGLAFGSSPVSSPVAGKRRHVLETAIGLKEGMPRHLRS